MVERAGGARELHLDGTLASVWRPGSPRTGSVWDALGAALLALPARRRRSVLLLGLGGGSAARLVRALAPQARIVGVEIDPEVVAAARRFFELDALGVEVVVADARTVLAERGGERFDAVLEDVFVGTGDDAVKPAGLPEPGLAHARRRLRPGGVLATNALDEAPRTAAFVGRLFGGGVRIRIAGYDNQVFLAGPRDLTARGLRMRVAACPVLAPTLPALSFRRLRGEAAARAPGSPTQDASRRPGRPARSG